MKTSRTDYRTSGIAMIVGGIAMVGLAGTAAAQTIEEELKITGSQPGPQSFGRSVAVSGSVAIIGDPFGSTGPDQSGAAYAFDVGTGDLLVGFSPTVADDAHVNGFGRSVAVRGDVAVVGGFYVTAAWSTASVFVFDVSTGVQLFRLDDPAPASVGGLTDFGVSVAINGSSILVGSPSSGLSPDTAAAYVFDRKSGVLLATATPDDDDLLQSSFGSTVAVSDTRFAVGFEDIWQVDVFDLDSGDRMFTVTPPPLTEANGYGNALGMSEAFLLVGTYGDRSIKGQLGAAYVYDAASGEHLRTITPPLEDQAFQFGWSVAVEGSIAVIGSFFDDEGFFDNPKDQKRGTAYVYDLNTGELLIKLRPSDSELSDDFGRVVAIDGETVVVGRPGDDEAGTNTGAAYIFTLSPFNCPGDATGNSTVDLDDLNLVLSNFGSATTEGDANGDGTVDLDDLNLVLTNFGTSCD